MSIRGLFRVHVSNNKSQVESSKVCGTAFVVARDNIDNTHYYLLTAYHVVSESIVRNQQIFLQTFDYDDKFFTSKISWIPDQSSCYEFGGDFALLEIFTDGNIEFNVFSLVPFDNRTIATMYIWGTSIYSPSDRHPEFNKISIKSWSSEHIIYSEPNCGKETYKSLVMTIDFAGNVQTDITYHQKDSLNITTAQNIFKGISGAPILIHHEGADLCVGLVSNIENDSIASRVYGVVSDTILTTCSILSHLFIKIEPEIDIIKKTPIHDLIDQFDLFVDIIFESPYDFSLHDPNTENDIWDKISNLFYKGHPIDSIIYRGINNNQINDYSIDTQLLLRYFLARLYFKRGKSDKALQQFAHIRKSERLISKNVWERIAVLMDSRILIENPVYRPNESLDKILHTEDQLSQLRTVNNEYKANELASILGTGLSNLFKEKRDLTIIECKKIREIYETHGKLLTYYPERLRKQDVVNTAIGWLINVWHINTPIDLDLLITDIRQGFKQANQRKNSIFHTQSLLAFSIYELLLDKYFNGLVVLFIVINLMKREKLEISHEGITQLLVYLKNLFPNYYWMFNLTFYHQGDEKTLFNKLHLYKDHLGGKEVSNAVILSQYINRLIYDNSHELYTIELSEIINLM